MPYIPGQSLNTKKSGYTPGVSSAARSSYTPGVRSAAVSPDKLGSSNDLYNLAVQHGFQADADRLLEKQTGEETKKIFSGGFISDIFDSLNALQYGVVGVLKGKSFMEGVKTRQSFSDKDALGDYGLPGVIGGIALDIAADPLTYVAPYTLVKKVPFLEKAVKATKTALFGKMAAKTIETGTDIAKTYETLEGGTRFGKYLGSKFAWMFGADPVFKETFERGVKNIAVGTQNIVELGKVVSKIEPATAAKILGRDETGRFVRKGLTALKSILSPEEFKAVEKLYANIDNLGKQAVDLGLLSKSKYEENIGEYIKNAYLEYEKATAKGFFGFKKLGIKGIFKRKEVKHISEFGLTQIDNPAYLLFKSSFDLIKDVENAKLLEKVSERFGTDVVQEGFTRVSKGIKWGKLAGKYVPDNIASYLNEIIEPSTNTVAKQAVANFKFFKVVMNPGTHARNIISNKLLNYWKLGMNPLDPRVIQSDLTALKEIAKGVGKWSDEARPLGYNLNTFAAAEMKSILDSSEVATWGKGLGKNWSVIKQKLGDVYQGEENWAKLSAYIFNRSHKGLDPEAAWKAAESATFNYAQVTPFVRKLREAIWGFPFITFSVKAAPVALETAVKAPGRISAIGKIKQAIENLSDTEETEAERASEPSWVKDGFYVKLPIKDKEGRSAYFDLTYILPFGDLISGNFFERQVNRETGLPESYPESFIKKSPFINIISEIGKNQDFYGNKIWRESDTTEKQLGDLMRHLTKSYIPPVIGDQLPGGYNEKGVRQQRGVVGALTPQEKENQQRTLMEELLRNVGAKIQPIDQDIQETYQEWNKRKALESLLVEKGIMQQFRKSYVPK